MSQYTAQNEIVFFAICWTCLSESACVHTEEQWVYKSHQPETTELTHNAYSVNVALVTQTKKTPVVSMETSVSCEARDLFTDWEIGLYSLLD